MSTFDLNKQPTDIRITVKNILSQMIGVEPSDLHDEDSFIEDLHMGPADLTDLTERLNNAQLQTTNLHFEDIETIGDLIDHLSAEEEI